MIWDEAWVVGIVGGWLLIEAVKMILGRQDTSVPKRDDSGVIGFTLQTLHHNQREILHEIHEINIKVSTNKTELEDLVRKIEILVDRLEKS